MATSSTTTDKRIRKDSYTKNCVLSGDRIRFFNNEFFQSHFQQYLSKMFNVEWNFQLTRTHDIDIELIGAKQNVKNARDDIKQLFEYDQQKIIFDSIIPVIQNVTNKEQIFALWDKTAMLSGHLKTFHFTQGPFATTVEKISEVLTREIDYIADVHLPKEKTKTFITTLDEFIVIKQHPELASIQCRYPFTTEIKISLFGRKNLIKKTKRQLLQSIIHQHIIQIGNDITLTDDQRTQIYQIAKRNYCRIEKFENQNSWIVCTIPKASATSATISNLTLQRSNDSIEIYLTHDITSIPRDVTIISSHTGAADEHTEYFSDNGYFEVKSVTQVKSLSLSDDEAPALTQYFSLHYFTLRQFIHLKTLSIYKVQCIRTLLNWVLGCKELSYLTHLEILNHDIEETAHNTHNLIERIWSLPYLTCCNLDTLIVNAKVLSLFSTISNTIKYFSIKNLCAPCALSACTPRLRTLCATITSNFKCGDLFQRDFRYNVQFTLFKDHDKDVDWNGCVWEETIQYYLPNLEVFQLEMEYNYLVILYTLPYVFDAFDHFNEYCSRSTSLDTEQKWSFHRVRTVQCDTINSNNIKLWSGYFPNIQHLDIPLLGSKSLLSCFPPLNYLTSLNVILQANFSYKQLQTLFDRAPHLYSLEVASGEKRYSSLPRLLQLNSASICRLDLRNWSYEHEDISTEIKRSTTFVNSFLGSKCEVLSINIIDIETIVDLIELMSNLRLLIVAYGHKNTSTIEYDGLIFLLKTSLPETYLIFRDRTNTRNMKIWIDRLCKLPCSSSDDTLSIIQRLIGLVYQDFCTKLSTFIRKCYH
ncbi:hypothetical protein I4U23_003712 [Adineta vaga]|nr:hypothetical protein I4U23_003712 [Adineta vaga]